MSYILSPRIQFNYDKKFDVLYYRWDRTDNTYGDEVEDDIILLRDIEANNIKGITVLNFKKRYYSNQTYMLEKYFDVEKIAKICFE